MAQSEPPKDVGVGAMLRKSLLNPSGPPVLSMPVRVPRSEADMNLIVIAALVKMVGGSVSISAAEIEDASKLEVSSHILDSPYRIQLKIEEPK